MKRRLRGIDKKIRSLLLGAALLAGVSLVLGACGNPSKIQTQGQQQRYQLHGKVVSIDKQQGQVVVDGDAIPGFMAAMAMPYPVKDAHSLDQLAPGDEIRAEVVVGDGPARLENIVIVKKAGAAAAPVTQWHEPQPGEAVPDFTLVDEDGKRISLRQFRGKTILLTFIYTRCPLPDFCPLMSTNFSLIEEQLLKNPREFAKTHLLSISFDSKYDTPGVLQKYGEGYLQAAGETKFRHWEFAVAPPDEMQKMAKFFGLVVQEEQGQIVHSLSTAIITPGGKIYKWYHGNDWKSSDVLNDLLGSLEGAKSATRLESDESHAASAS